MEKQAAIMRMVAVAAVAALYVGLAAVGLDSAFTDSRAPSTTAGPVVSTASSLEGALAGSDDGATIDSATPVNGATAGAGASGATGTPRGPAGSSAPGAGAAGAAAAEPLQIGFEYIEAFDASFIGANAESTDFGDPVPATTRIVEWVNENGGIGGRPVEPIFHGTRVETTSFAQQAQEACAKFAEDNHAFAVVSGFVGGAAGLLLPCLADHGVALMAQDRSTYDDVTMAEFPSYLYMVGRMSMTRWAGMYIDGLTEQGYFDGATVGVAYFDTPEFRRAMEQVRPRLAAHGAAAVEEVAISFFADPAGLSGVASQLQSAILRFRTAGVTHVLLVDYAGTLAFLFIPQAESQSYRPRYGFNTANNPGLQALNYPPEQLAGSVAVGWNPRDDGVTQDPTNAAAQFCTDIVGVPRLPTDSLGHCDALMTMRAALDGAATVDVATLRARVERLGSSFESPTSHATFFGPGRHDGPEAVRYYAYDASCRCYLYTTEPRPLPGP